MGTSLAAPSLLLLLAGAAGLCRALFSLPLRVSPPASPGGSPSAPVLLRPASSSRRQQEPLGDTDGLALASDPGGTLNFLAMVENLQGDSGRGYYLEMLIGSPPQALNILVDTGSSNFAVAGAPDPDVTSYFNPELSSTYKSQGIDVTVKYTQGSWTGMLGTDVITIPKGINGSYTINIATILESENFFLPGVKWHGILGLAYDALPSSSVETFFDSLVRQAKIPNIFSLQMCGAGLPVSGSGTNGGSLVLGGIEPSLYKGDIWYTPIKEEWYYQVEILKLEVGGQNLELDCREIQEFSSGFWTGSQLACWDKTERPWSLFPKLSIYLRDENSSRSFRISILPQLYIQPILGIGENLQCYRFGISSSTNALVIGATVMEGFYVIFDRAQRRVGFAVSPCAGKRNTQSVQCEGLSCLTGFLWRPVMSSIATILMKFIWTLLVCLWKCKRPFGVCLFLCNDFCFLVYNRVLKLNLSPGFYKILNKYVLNAKIAGTGPNP
uniref:Beta-secretase 2 n=1 Tax=Apteryx owenii TaxID=8824 RepID=A0A8B9Q6M6_APTOW